MFGFNKKKKLEEELRKQAEERSKAIKIAKFEESKKKLIAFVTNYPNWIQQANKPYAMQGKLKVKDTLRNASKRDIFDPEVISFKYQFELPPFIARDVTLTSKGERLNNVKQAAIEEVDPLYDSAVNIVLETRKASISGVQRRLKIGYNRAASMIEMMEEKGLISPMESNGQREVLAPPTESGIQIEKQEYDILENLSPELVKYYSEIRTESHPENPKEIKTHIELLFEPKICVYHLDVLFKQIGKSINELTKSIQDSKSLYDKRVFIEFWETQLEVNSNILWLNSLVKMINNEIKEYSSAKKKIIANKLSKISNPPLMHYPQVDMGGLKEQAGYLREYLDGASSDYEFSSMLQQMKKGDGFFTNDMKFINSMAGMLGNSLGVLNNCLSEVERRGENINDSVATITDLPDQKAPKSKARKKPRIQKLSDVKAYDGSGVTGRKSRVDASAVPTEGITGRKPRVDDSIDQDSVEITGRKPRIDSTVVKQEYTGRKPRRG